MIKLPLNGNWTQENKSDRVGSLAWTKNINLDKKGYIKLSPRSVNIFDNSEDTTNVGDTNFNIPVALGRTSNGQFYLATTDEPFNINLANTAKTIAEDSASNNPNLNFQSHGAWFQNRFHESTDTTVGYNTAGTWTASAITGLTSGVRHYITTFASRNQICVSNGNVVKQYDTAYSNTTDLTIPSDFEITGLAYNNSRMAVITRLGNDSSGQNQESRFYLWDGASTGAISDAGVGAYATIAVKPYKTSFIILTSSGQLLYWNGGGFEELASFPFYFSELHWGDLLNHFAYGDNIVVDGDNILINVGFDLSGVSKKREEYLVSNPSGVWCYDPEIGLYHKYSPSLSRAYLHTITSGNINTTTNIFTTTSTIPNTGNPVIMPTNTISDLQIGQVYYVIKLSPTTFKLATSYDNAIIASAIDITSVSATNYLWLYDVRDYGISYYTSAGCVGLFDTTSSVYKDIIFGGRLLNTSLTAVSVLNMCVPQLENRGYAVTPKLFLNAKTETVESLVIKYAPLNTEDKIIVKVKDKDIFGIPTTTPNNSSDDTLTWVTLTTATTTTDLSEVKTAFDAGEELELELTAGVGAGQMVKITNITESSGTYTLTIEEDIKGFVAGLKSYFSIDNWRYCGEVDSTNQQEGVFECPIGKAGKSLQFKIELRGYQTTVEDIFIKNHEHTK